MTANSVILSRPSKCTVYMCLGWDVGFRGKFEIPLILCNVRAAFSLVSWFQPYKSL